MQLVAEAREEFALDELAETLHVHRRSPGEDRLQRCHHVSALDHIAKALGQKTTARFRVLDHQHDIREHGAAGHLRNESEERIGQQSVVEQHEQLVGRQALAVSHFHREQRGLERHDDGPCFATTFVVGDHGDGTAH